MKTLLPWEKKWTSVKLLDNCSRGHWSSMFGLVQRCLEMGCKIDSLWEYSRELHWERCSMIMGSLMAVHLDCARVQY